MERIISCIFRNTVCMFAKNHQQGNQTISTTMSTTTITATATTTLILLGARTNTVVYGLSVLVQIYWSLHVVRGMVHRGCPSRLLLARCCNTGHARHCSFYRNILHLERRRRKKSSCATLQNQFAFRHETSV